ncbi:MAG: PVC-type heme-binding CxxCH protein [Planctomycetota bacterium]|nr:PVC-type heme-binding CxxCH protein [Planctomycetota bacterium]
MPTRAILLVLFVLAIFTPPSLRADEEDGFRSIFNGRDLSGWSGDPKFWSVEEGAITGRTTPTNPTKSNTFLIWTQGEVDDFVLKLKYRIADGNSGIQYRSVDLGNHVVSGHQADFEAGDTWSGAHYEERGRGTLARRGEKTKIGEDGKGVLIGTFGDTAALQGAIQQKDWNDYEIIASGNRMIHKINGVTMSEIVDDYGRKNGILALQLHVGPPMEVQFKDIRLKRLPLAGKKKAVFIAGRDSHSRGTHEHNAGCTLLAMALNENVPGMHATVYRDGWPADPTALDNADTIILYADGGPRHPVIPHLEEVDALNKKGVGVVCMHYGVEVPKGEAGDRFLDWTGGHFETHWSVNPVWTADFKEIPDHPVTRGVPPFGIRDEYYYHMRFRDGMEGVTPILTDLPPPESLERSDGPHTGNPHVRAAIERGEKQHVAWASEQAGRGRGFGYTGGHFHQNWGNDNVRKLILNAITWTAGAEVPEEGISSDSLSEEDLRGLLPKPAEPKKEAGAKKSAPHKPPPKGQAATEPAPFDVHPELAISLFAADPMLGSPSNIDIDHRGRVWVCEVMNYRGKRKQRPEGDRILILEDTDSDGRADVQKVFYQGPDINSPHGVCVLDNRVIVSAGENVFILTDTDGDDKADQKETLFTGIGGWQHDHGIHAFFFGPDGRLYFNFGNAGQQLKDPEGNICRDLAGNQVNDKRNPYQQGMVFRCRPDGSQLETLGWNFRNNWMVVPDSFGTLWQSDNDDDGNEGVRINYVMEFGNYGYREERTGTGWHIVRTGRSENRQRKHWHQNDPGVVPDLLYTGAGSPTGITVYEGRLLPEALHDQMIHCDAGPGVVRAYPVRRSGAGYEAETVDLIRGGRDKQFRPSDVAVAPDGSLFVADWHDPGVGGHQAADLASGRIFRVVPRNAARTYRVDPFDFESAEGAASALKNPNNAVRFLAYRRLEELGEEAKDALLEIWRSDNPRHRARALWLLAGLPDGEAFLHQAIADENPDLRITALRAARRDQRDLLPLIRDLLDDPSPQVRRECLLALRHHPAEEAADLWAQLALAHDGEDRWYLEALGIAADRQWDRYFAAWLARVGDDWQQAAGRDIVWRSRADAALPLLAAIIKSSPPEQRARYFRAFDFHEGNPEKKQQALESLLVR